MLNLSGMAGWLAFDQFLHGYGCWKFDFTRGQFSPPFAVVWMILAVGKDR